MPEELEMTTDQKVFRVCYSDEESDYIDEFRSLDDVMNWITNVIDDEDGVYYIEVERKE
jgi:hypothetical protein